MGRAIVRNPQVFLFDEPLSNLDAKLRVQMRSEIRELHQRLGTTTVYVTHDQIEAMTMADRIVVMRDGRISQIGAPLELYDNPANVFVAGFIGSPAMNLLEGEVRPDGSFACAGIALPLRVRLEPGRKVTFGVRPEHLLLTDTGLPVTVVVVEPTGSEIHLVLRAGDQEMTAAVRERRSFTPGQTLHVTPEPGMVHLFDTATGERI
jgi:multiple sugar transport system ATP-binding protein